MAVRSITWFPWDTTLPWYFLKRGSSTERFSVQFRDMRPKCCAFPCLCALCPDVTILDYLRLIPTFHPVKIPPIITDGLLCNKHSAHIVIIDCSFDNGSSRCGHRFLWGDAYSATIGRVRSRCPPSPVVVTNPS